MLLVCRKGKLDFAGCSMNVSSLYSTAGKKKSQDKGNIMLFNELVVHPNFVAVLPLLQKEHMGTWKDTENQAGKAIQQLSQRRHPTHSP